MEKSSRDHSRMHGGRYKQFANDLLAEKLQADARIVRVSYVLIVGQGARVCHTALFCS
jgi:hypothetical protein